MVKEFSLTEKEITIMDLTDYYASFLVAIVAAYYGGKGNRSKWLAASAFILGISSIVFAVPFYKYEIIKPLEESEGEIFQIYYHIVNQYLNHWFCKNYILHICL